VHGPVAGEARLMQGQKAIARRTASISASWADAVFGSGLQRRDEPSAGQVRQAVVPAIRAFGCSRCAGRVTQEFGDHPETAVVRMRWARGLAREAFADSPGRQLAGAER
jgi:hypothetical protein